MSGYRIRDVLKRTENEFFANYKGCTVQVDREEDPCPGGYFYIIVTTHGGGHLYDGWWGDEEHTLDDAIKQALRGSLLAEEGGMNAFMHICFADGPHSLSL